MNLEALSAKVSRELGTAVHIDAASDAAEFGQMDAMVESYLSACQFDARRRDWLIGRAALMRVCRKIGVDDNPVAMQFPNRAFSLTHCSGLALAAGVSGMAGIGIDFEAWRPVKRIMARWYLGASEAASLDGLPEQECSHILLRLWTIKEALFKACPDNHGLTLLDFQLPCPDKASGLATVSRPTDLSFTYTSWALETGILSVAIAAVAPQVGSG